MSLLTYLGRLLGITERAPPSRLAESEALALARAAVMAQDQSASDQFYVQTIREAAGSVTWCVRTASKGSWWSAEVDDRTGAVTALRRHGVR